MYKTPYYHSNFNQTSFCKSEKTIFNIYKSNYNLSSKEDQEL